MLSTIDEIQEILQKAEVLIKVGYAQRIFREDFGDLAARIARDFWQKAQTPIEEGKLTREQAIGECSTIVASLSLDAILKQAQKDAVSKPKLVSGRLSDVQKVILHRLGMSEDGVTEVTPEEVSSAKRLAARSPRLELHGHLLCLK